MNTYIQNDGTVTTCRFMQAPALKPGYIWINVSRLGAYPMEFLEVVDYSVNPDKTIFGYPEKEFLAKQYR